MHVGFAQRDRRGVGFVWLGVSSASFEARKAVLKIRVFKAGFCIESYKE